MNLKKFFFSFFSILSIIGYGVFVFAAPPGVGGYNPGEILDPECAPGDVDCVVKLQISGGGSPAGSDNQIQINQSGSFFADGTFQKSDTGFNLGLDHTAQSPITFTGSGLDDFALAGAFSGTLPTTYTVTIDGVNQDFIVMESSTISGGTFSVGNTITNGLGGSATVLSINTATPLYSNEKTFLRVTINSGSFSSGDTIDNGSGVTGTLDNDSRTSDTFTWTDGTTTQTNVVLANSNGLIFATGQNTGHTLSDSWTWTYSTVNQNVLDFSNNDYKFQSTFGTDTFGYQITDNLFGFGIAGSANTYTNVAGDFGLSGILNTDELVISNFIELATGEMADSSLGATGYDLSIRDALGIETLLNLTSNKFSIINDNSTNRNGIEFNTIGTGLLRLGNLSGGNGTSITIDDIAQTINFNNNYSFPFADGAAGQVLGTDGSGQLGWVTVSGGGSSPTLTNGLQFIGGDIGLGGTITGNTTIDQDGYDFLVQDGENSFGLLHFPGGLISGIMHYEPGVERYGISYLDISGAKSINLSYSSETSLKSHGFTLNNDTVSMSSRSASASENFWTSIYIESNQQEIKMTGSNDLNTGNTVWQNTALSDLTGDTHADLATIRNDGTWRWNFYPNTRNDSATVTPINFLYTDALGNIFSAPKALILGTGTTAPSFSEYAAGSYNTAYTPASAFIWSATDRLFTIGNGLATGFESDAFTILKNGETGIGIDNFETNTNGNIFQVGDGSTSVIGYVDDVTGNWVNVSDERKKNNIQDLSYGLHEILQLRPTSFDYKRNGEHAIGFIAQEVLPIIPESVYGTESEGYGMSYATLTPVIVKAIQEMNLNITELTNMERPNTWRDSLIAWFGNVENGITEFIAGTIRAKTQICIDDVCMTKDQLRQVLEQNNIQNTVDVAEDIVQPDENSDTQLTPTDTPVDTSTDVSVDDSTTPTENNTDTTELTSVISDVSAEQSPE